MKKQILRLWAGLLLVLALTVQAAALPRALIPGGGTVGVKLYTQGLMVTGFDEDSPAQQAGLRKGDVILRVDGAQVRSTDSLRQAMYGGAVVLTVLRDGREATFRVMPTKTKEGFRLGAYIRDSLAGIGTVTYYDPDTGAFGALGHGVGDQDTGALLPIEAGVVVRSTVTGVEKGKAGTPGELKGKFDVETILGNVTDNTEHGIFGTLTTPVPGKPLPLAKASEIKPGPAEILSNVHGREVQAYSVKILKIYPAAKETGRNLLLEITDQRLLDATGGIVQGMSGSPLIQNGKLIGAVTHVLVNEPRKGYGIFIENMLEAAE